MQISQNGIDLLKSLEGCSKTVYLDSGGAPTIGIGHLLTKSERASGKIAIAGNLIPYVSGLSDEQVETLLKSDLLSPITFVSQSVKVSLNQNQFDALVSFAFNVGVWAFNSSTLRKVLNAGRYDQVPEQMKRWVHDNGKVVRGLINRRNAEIALWNKPVD